MLDIPRGTRSEDTTMDRVAVVVARVAARHNLTSAIGMADSLVDKGMTSIAMVDLMLAIEAGFNVTIPQRDMTPANFQSIECLAHLLTRL